MRKVCAKLDEPRNRLKILEELEQVFSTEQSGESFLKCIKSADIWDEV